MMRTAKIGMVAALIVATCLGLLWVTEAVPRGAGADTTDKPVP
jgi:hypothetical protein